MDAIKNSDPAHHWQLFLSTHSIMSQKTWIFIKPLHYKHTCTTSNWQLKKWKI